MTVRILVAFTLLVLPFAWGCGEMACSPCPPGTHASHPSEHCSACVADTDGGTDAAPSQ